MTAAVAIPPIALPLPPVVMLEPERDATSRAVLRYFEAVADQADAFEHLVAICRKAVRPYYLRERDGIGTREWIEEWLARFLAGYAGKTENELSAAADNGEFQHLGNGCRSALVSAIRAAKAKKRVSPPTVSLDEVITEDGATLLEFLGTVRQDAPSCLATGSSFENGVHRLLSAFRAVMANRQELTRLDLLDGLRATLANADRENESFRQFHARVILSVARTRNVSLQAARTYVRNMKNTIASEMKAGNPALRAVYLELQAEPPAYAASPGSIRTQTLEVQPDPVSLTAEFHKANGSGWDDPEK